MIKFNTESNKMFISEEYSGEDIHEKIDRIMTTEEPIEEDPNAARIYTKRKDGVLPMYNVRTDKWELALEIKDEINKDKIAKAEAYTKAIEPDETETTQKE